MSTSFVKLYGSILTSSVWDKDPETKVVWVTLLAMADEDGIARTSIPGLARLANVGIEACEAALEDFKSPDPYSGTKVEEGRRIREIEGGFFLINHAEYRDKQTQKQKADAKRQREHYARKKREEEAAKRETSQNLTRPHAPSRSLAPNTDTYTDTDKKIEIESVSTISASVLKAFQPEVSKEALLPRLMRLGDPQSYEDWWRKVLNRMEKEDGLTVVYDAIQLVERNDNPLQRETRGEGVIDDPSRYVASECKKHLALFGKRLPAPPVRQAS